MVLIAQFFSNIFKGGIVPKSLHLQLRLNVCTEGAHEVSCDCEQRIKQDIKFKFEEYQVLIKCSVYILNR